MSRRAPSEAGPLKCPSCGGRYPTGERFCPMCRMPLVFTHQQRADELSERQEWARKIKPQLAEGSLIKVVGARNQAEAEFIQGLLLEEGVPSIVRRSAGFDVPDFLAAGPRDVLVAQSGAPTAREILLQAELLPASPQRVGTSPVKLLAALVGALALGALIVWVVLALHS